MAIGSTIIISAPILFFLLPYLVTPLFCQPPPLNLEDGKFSLDLWPCLEVDKTLAAIGFFLPLAVGCLVTFWPAKRQ